MAERIELPMTPAGTEQEQLQQMFSYLYRTAQVLNVNLAEIGNGALTDDEQVLFNQLTAGSGSSGDDTYYPGYNYKEAETLKSLIIKTAQFVKTETDNYRIILFGEESAEGQYGNWIRKKGLRVDVTPDGIKQTYSYAEIIKGLKTFEINSKNYIKTGLLRTEQGLPVYGVAIGKDVVEFLEDGTEQYKDENKVAELTADELSFWQNGVKVASYTGDNLIFYQGGVEKMKIDANGVTVLNGTTKLAELLGSALKFYYSGTLRTQMDGDGVKIYDGSTLLATLGSGGISFTNGSTKLAELLTTALKLYYNGTLRSQMDTDGVKFYDGSTLLATISSTGISFTNGSTKLMELLTSALKFYYNGTLRAQMDTDGIQFVNGSTKLAELLTSALKFYYNGTLRTQMDTDGITFSDGTTKLAELLTSALKFYYNGALRTQMDTDGVKIYNGSDTVLAELLGTAMKFYYSGALRAQMDANGVSFWNGATKLAEMNGTKISFFNDGSEVLYLQNGKLYCTTDFTIQTGGKFFVDADNLTIGESGLEIQGGTIVANIYTSKGYPPMTREDIVVSTTEPAPKEGRVWIKPLDTASVEYTAVVSERTNFTNGNISKSLSGTADTGQTGTNAYKLKLPVYSATSSNHTLAVNITVTDGTNTITFPQQQLPHGYYDGSGFHSSWVLEISLSDATWIATANSLTITIAPDGQEPSYKMAQFGIDIGQISLVANSTGSGGSGWKNCEVKVYQG